MEGLLAAVQVMEWRVCGLRLYVNVAAVLYGSFIRRILFPSLNVSWALQVSSSGILLRDFRAAGK